MRRPILERKDLPLKPRMLQVSIRVADLDRSDAFYTQVIGMERRGRLKPRPNVEERFYGFESDRHETLICLLHVEDAPLLPRSGAPMEAPVMFNLTVGDVRGICAKVEAAGGAIISAPITQPILEFEQDMAFITDPDGTTIELTSFR